MVSIRKRLRFFFVENFYSVERWRWVVVLLVGLGLLWAEIYEFIELTSLNQPFHMFEVFLYAVLLLGTGLFLELFVRLNRIHKRMAKILDYKHKLSLELTLINDWDSLVTRLAELPGKIVDADESYLLAGNPLGFGLGTLSHWLNEKRPSRTERWEPLAPCQKCLESQSLDMPAIHLCDEASQAAPYHVYSLRFIDESSPITMLKFRMTPGVRLSPDEEKILSNISDELAVALHAGRDQKRLSELQSAEVAMAERRLVSSYVHDRLGQNLGYLHLKLDHLSENESAISSRKVREDLAQLREVANDSYEIVRDILKLIQPETIPNLTNLLKEHAQRVARSADFMVKFKSTGEPVMLSSESQQIIFYAFREIVSNVEKHAKASIVEVLVAWCDCSLDISVTDNGEGFDPASVRKDEHFGLGILQERMAKLKGSLTIESTKESGTVVSLCVPI